MPDHVRWLDSIGFKGSQRRSVLLPGSDGSLAGVALGVGAGRGDPAGPATLLVGQLSRELPPGAYRLADSATGAEAAAIAWGLGAYRFRRYKSGDAEPVPRLEIPPGVARDRVLAIVEAVWRARDLINTPAEDLGPAELEAAVRDLAGRHDATVETVAGDDLLARNFPMIHAVGRASTRAPRLIDLTWGREGARTVTLVGKGICFDTGGLDIKSAAGMLLMKKDMGGAAVAIALAAMVMALKLDVRLRLLVAAADNAIAGNAFRPGDVLTSRAGKSVEVGNTDAEGRLVLADALALADEAAPDTILTFSTLTGAARVALGPELPAMFTDDDALAAEILDAGLAVGDPAWRLPLWPGYERSLDSEIADMGNVSDGPFAGSIVAALFLRRFVRQARRFAHFDLYAWRPAARPLGPKGGEPQIARALLALLERELQASVG